MVVNLAYPLEILRGEVGTREIFHFIHFLRRKGLQLRCSRGFPHPIPAQTLSNLRLRRPRAAPRGPAPRVQATRSRAPVPQLEDNEDGDWKEF